MLVDTDQVDARVRNTLLDGLRSGTGIDPKSKLGVVLAGGNVLVRVGFDTWSDPKQYRRH